ncbi:MAG: phosphopyruvate hydratase [Patescibacteria group bacterium]
MFKVTNVNAWQVLDSRGLPTVCCEITVENLGKTYRATASVPSGASTGTHEALELRDGEAAFGGKGVSKAVNNILNSISKEILNKEFASARELDELVLGLDHSENKSELGANAILGVSMAAHRAAAEAEGKQLYQYLGSLYFNNGFESLDQVKFPRPMCNVVNGGVHADSGLSVQEFMLVPKGGNIEKDLQISAEVYQTLKKLLKNRGDVTAVGDEGGFAPHLGTTEEALNLLQEAIDKSGYSDECDLALDVAASEFYSAESNAVDGIDAGAVYNYQGRRLKGDEMIAEYAALAEKYNIVSIEDGLAEDDLAAWKGITNQLGDKMMLVGDDLFVTNVKRFQSIGLDQGIANAILIKLNQIGSVSETCDVINLAQKNGYNTVISHRSGETTDDFIADLVVASSSPFFKAGSMSRGERLAKYNRLLEILHSQAK